MLLSCEAIFKGVIKSVGISKDNGRLVASVGDGTVAVSSRVWGEDWSSVHSTTWRFVCLCMCVCFCCLGYISWAVQVWCASSGSLLFTVPHDQYVYSCALNANGSLVAVGLADCSLKVSLFSCNTAHFHYTVPICMPRQCVCVCWLRYTMWMRRTGSQ